MKAIHALRLQQEKEPGKGDSLESTVSQELYED